MYRKDDERSRRSVGQYVERARERIGSLTSQFAAGAPARPTYRWATATRITTWAA